MFALNRVLILSLMTHCLLNQSQIGVQLAQRSCTWTMHVIYSAV